MVKYRKRDIFSPKTKKIILNIGEKDYDILYKYSRQLNISMAYLIVSAIKEYMERKIES